MENNKKSAARPAASVIVLAFGPEPWLESCLRSALSTTEIEVEVLVVDNGTEADLVGLAAVDPRVRVVGTGDNLGFAGGVNYAVAQSRGDVVVLLNSDAELEPGALVTLVKEASQPGAGIVGALVLLSDSPGTVNSWGNPLHVLGLSWAGGYGASADQAPQAANVASASGACLALSRGLWDQLQGFSPLYFAYFEDMDLSWRCHQLGLPVTVRANIRVVHHYEFSRSPIKVYLLERNRLLFLLTNHQGVTLFSIAAPLLALELSLFAIALVQGWAAEKARGWVWLWHNRRAIRARRRWIQRSRRLPDASLLGLISDTFDTEQLSIPRWTAPLQAILRGYWRVASLPIAATGKEGHR